MRAGARVLALVAGLLASPSILLAAPPSDAWLEGYASAVLEREMRLTIPSLRATQGVITLTASDVPVAEQPRVLEVLSSIRGVTRVEIVGGPPPAARETAPAGPPRVLADWQIGVLPGGTLFRPLIADPRWPHFAASYQRYLDDRQLQDVGAVSFGETFTLFRDRLGPAWWEVGIQAGVFAVFDLNADSADLVNADYMVGVPLSLRYDNWSAIFRLFHQSSHLGDEFLLRTQTERVNLSYEAVDLRLSYEFGDVLRVYGGGGFIFHKEPTSLDPWSIQYGLELISPWPARTQHRWRPIAAADLQQRQENDWSVDLSLRAGIQIDGVLASRNMQILLEYFRGRSPNGQFYRDKIEYFGIGTHFHF
jgi:hypothetical protein